MLIRSIVFPRLEALVFWSLAMALGLSSFAHQLGAAAGQESFSLRPYFTQKELL